MIGTVVTRVGAVVTAAYLVFINPTFIGEGTPLFAVAIAFLFLADVFGLMSPDKTNPF